MEIRLFIHILEVSNQNNTDMKKKIFTALLSLVTIAGFAIVDRPQVSLSAQGPVGVLPYEEFTFTISYRNIKEINVDINGVIDSNIWTWSWEKEDPDWRTKDYTDKIMDYEVVQIYTVTVTNDYGLDYERIMYVTPGHPYVK